MRILFCHRPGGAFGYITDAMINALRDKGHTVSRWDGLEESWRVFAPDLYCGCSGHPQPIPAKHNAKIAIHVNPHGPVQLGGKDTGLPVINEAEPAIRWTLNQKPDCVFGYGQEEDRILWSHWTTKHGVPWVPMPTAGDRTVFKQTMTEEQKQHDLVYLGGRWAYKGITIDAYLVSALQTGRFNYKLHGWGEWPKGLCSGGLADDQACRFLNSGRIGPCISERHTHAYGIDIPERAFKVALCGALVVHDTPMGINRMIPSVIAANNPEQFLDRLTYFSRPENSSERIVMARQQQREVLSAHTYHHRLAGLFLALGWSDEASHMLS